MTGGGGITREDITIRPETRKDYKDIISLILRSFSEGTDYSDGTDVVALVEEIRESEFYIRIVLCCRIGWEDCGTFPILAFSVIGDKERRTYGKLRHSNAGACLGPCRPPS